mmetsp:Transcript_9431/g.22236  ORF Transcript_9431/g.22236 Transcript_9431/m.22236 type:complete len:483 (+) Transcript_9431:329-1777(+)
MMLLWVVMAVAVRRWQSLLAVAVGRRVCLVLIRRRCSLTVTAARLMRGGLRRHVRSGRARPATIVVVVAWPLVVAAVEGRPARVRAVGVGGLLLVRGPLMWYLLVGGLRRRRRRRRLRCSPRAAGLGRVLPALLSSVLVALRVLGQILGLGGVRRLPKVVVVQRLLSGDPLRRVHRQQRRQQLLRLLVQHSKLLVEAVRVGLVAALRRDHLVVVQLGKPRPRLLRGRAKHLEDFVDLLKLVLPGQDRLLQEQLGEDAADGPHVHRWAVELRAQQQLRWAIPQRDHPVGQLAARVVKRPRQAEICQLQLPLVVDQEVGAFDVAMQHAVLVAICQPFKQLLHVTLNLRRRESCARIGQPREIVVAELHDHVDRPLAVVVLACFGRHNLLQLHDVFVVQHLENLDLPDRRHGEPFLLVVHTHPLQSHDLPRHLIPGLVHLPVRPLPHLLHLLVDLDVARAARGVGHVRRLPIPSTTPSAFPLRRR